MKLEDLLKQKKVVLLHMYNSLKAWERNILMECVRFAVNRCGHE